ncbi:hypothetical protein [Streptomyces kebangsaanensis]|uniref:hypothetical protein n=1 Tax=Streptomyces kebangsaanensis TaxID=864058 RepID=UPI00093A264B
MSRYMHVLLRSSVAPEGDRQSSFKNLQIKGPWLRSSVAPEGDRQYLPPEAKADLVELRPSIAPEGNRQRGDHLPGLLGRHRCDPRSPRG